MAAATLQELVLVVKIAASTDARAPTRAMSDCDRCARGGRCTEHEWQGATSSASIGNHDDVAPILLSDAEVQAFIATGIHVLPPSPGSEALHARAFALCEERARQRNPGNNILAAMPSVLGAAVLDRPAVRGALTSLLGRGYALHGHRYCHARGPGAGAQNWHRDGYASGYRRRCHRPRWIMAMYYPQETSRALGNAPTAVIPGSQYCAAASGHRALVRDVARAGAAVCPRPGPGRAVPPAAWGTPTEVDVPAGGIVLIAFDLWHRGTENTLAEGSPARYMIKLQWVRTEEPGAVPSWNHTPEGGAQRVAWPLADATSPALPELWHAIWRWMLGGAAAATDESAAEATGDADGSAEVAQLAARLGYTTGRRNCLATHECIGLDPVACTPLAAATAPPPPAAAAAASKPGNVDVHTAEETQREAQELSATESVQAATALALPDHELPALRAAARLGRIAGLGDVDAARALLAAVLDPAQERDEAAAHAARHAAYALADGGLYATAPMAEVIATLVAVVTRTRGTGQAWRGRGACAAAREHACFVLGELGATRLCRAWYPADAAMDKLAALCSVAAGDPCQFVRAAAVEALGTIGARGYAPEIVLRVALALVDVLGVLRESSGRVLSAASFSLLRVVGGLGRAPETRNAIAECLAATAASCPERYARGFALEALRRLALTTPCALASLLDQLMRERRCPLTSHESPY